MATGNLPFRRYVDIDSGVIGAATIQQRELIGRLMTDNGRLPSGVVKEFSDADGVGDFFGRDTEEFKRAQFYFNWVSKQLTRPSRISFARYAIVDTPARILGGDHATLSSFQSLGTTEELVVVIGGTSYTTEVLDFGNATDLTSVASIVQEGLRNASPDTAVATCSVTFDATANEFQFASGNSGAISVSIPTDQPLADRLGWTDAAGAIFIDGSAQVQPDQAVSDAHNISDNYGSLAFITEIGIEQHVEVAKTLQGFGAINCLYCMAVTKANALAWQSRLANVGGVAIGIIEDANDQENYVDMIPMIQAAATRYDREGATSTYMYKEFDVPVTVTDDDDADIYDSLRLNYYGQTQKAGRKYAFYQRGFLQGPDTSPADQSVFVNEIWLKDQCEAAFMSLLRDTAEVPANETGRLMGRNVLQSCVDAALRNGVISVDKQLSLAQVNAVTRQSNSSDAWRQVQGKGYWYDVRVLQFQNNGQTEYKLDYLLIYSKKDVIRKVEGVHALV